MAFVMVLAVLIVWAFSVVGIIRTIEILFPNWSARQKGKHPIKWKFWKQ